jgi:formate/nitrite transporter FocA (FNT family)
MFASWFIILACIILITMMGGLEKGFRSSFPAITKAIGGVSFPIALIFILFAGGDLFTGNCMTCTMAFVHGKLSIRQCAEVLINTFLTNLGWCLFFAWFLGFKTNLFVKEPFNSMVKSIAMGKIVEPFDVVILKGIGANSLVCLAVVLGTIARSDLGKVVLIWIPIAVFVTLGNILFLILIRF